MAAATVDYSSNSLVKRMERKNLTGAAGDGRDVIVGGGLVCESIPATAVTTTAKEDPSPAAPVEPSQ